jgi:hypothetical protein
MMIVLFVTRRIEMRRVLRCSSRIRISMGLIGLAMGLIGLAMGLIGLAMRLIGLGMRIALRSSL